MPGAFNLETRDGFRLVEFDPDVLLGRDVRILVDGHRVAEMPHPKPSSPYQEISFGLNEHTLIAVAFIPREPQSPPADLVFDLFNEGLSLSGGPSLAHTRANAPRVGQTYPGAFKMIDIALQIAPGAAAPGLSIGLASGADRLGWPTVVAIGAVMLGGLTLAAGMTSKVWKQIRADNSRSVRQRAALGWAILIGSTSAGFAGGIGLIVLIR